MNVIKLRETLSKYNEWFFMAYVLPLNACTAAGLTSENEVYQLFFFLGLIALIIKLICTNYSKRELLIMLAVLTLLGIVFINNHEKTLILSALAVFGAKGVPIRKIIGYMLIPRIFFTALTVGLACLNLIPNQEVLLPKNGEDYVLYCYGFYQPNVLYINLFLIVLLFIERYRDRLKSWAYIGFGIILFGAYQILYSRTGWYLYLLLCVIFAAFFISKKYNIQKVYLLFFTGLPIILACFSFLTIALYKNDIGLIQKLDFILTGRIRLMAQAIDISSVRLIGNVPRIAFDNSYIHIFYNYGIIMLFLVLYSLYKTMITLWKQNMEYEVLIFGILAIYAFMEQFPLNATWNPFLLFFAYYIFRDQEYR